MHRTFVHRLGRIGVTLCCTLAAGCSSLSAPPERSPEAEKIVLYEGVPRDPRPYTLVKRVWVESWRSAFTVPKYPSRREGAYDLQNQAVALGGDAIMNFGCYRLDAYAPEPRPNTICNGNVIKFVQ